MRCWPARFSPVVKFKRCTIILGSLVLLAGGAALQSMKQDWARAELAQVQPAKTGGYRTLAADYSWLQTNLAWETRDAAKVRRMIDLTVSADPRTAYFWLNGARMIAYDFPVWQDDFAGANAPLAVQASWRKMGADEALLLLERGQQWHGKSAALHLEMANICLYALGDRHRAAGYYRLAAEQSDAPDYAARIYARLHEEEVAGISR